MYARLVKGTAFLSREYGSIHNQTLNLNQGFLDTGTLFLFLNAPLTLMFGGNRMKNARNRGMLFGSWTGTSIEESASAVVGDSTGVKDCKVTAATFGTQVNKLSGEYVFLYTGESWELNGTPIVGLNDYGLVATGDPQENDIIVVTYTAASGGWEALGKDNDDLSKELNPDTEMFSVKPPSPIPVTSRRLALIRTTSIRPARCTSVCLISP